MIGVYKLRNGTRVCDYNAGSHSGGISPFHLSLPTGDHCRNCRRGNDESHNSRTDFTVLRTNRMRPPHKQRSSLFRKWAYLRDPFKKFTHRIWSYSEDKIEIELKQCIALCRHCHEKFHALAKSRKIEHGTTTAYRYGCRCQECRDAKNSAYRARKVRNA